MVLQALARTDQRGVLYEGWGGLRKKQLPEHWLHPTYLALSSHGYGGTLWRKWDCRRRSAAVVPSIITPFFADQPFWGRRVYELSVGPKPIAHRRLTVDNLTEAIGHAGSGEEMKKRATSLGERIRAENSVAQAVTIIEKSRG